MDGEDDLSESTPSESEDLLADLALRLRDMLYVSEHATVRRNYDASMRLLAIEYSPRASWQPGNIPGESSPTLWAPESLLQSIATNPWDGRLADELQALVDSAWVVDGTKRRAALIKTVFPASGVFLLALTVIRRRLR